MKKMLLSIFSVLILASGAVYAEENKPVEQEKKCEKCKDMKKEKAVSKSSVEAETQSKDHSTH